VLGSTATNAASYTTHWDTIFVRGIGNVIRHEYYALADAIIWGVVVDELPALRVAVEALKAHFDQA